MIMEIPVKKKNFTLGILILPNNEQVITQDNFIDKVNEFNKSCKSGNNELTIPISLIGDINALKNFNSSCGRIKEFDLNKNILILDTNKKFPMFDMLMNNKHLLNTKDMIADIYLFGDVTDDKINGKNIYKINRIGFNLFINAKSNYTSKFKSLTKGGK